MANWRPATSLAILRRASLGHSTDVLLSLSACVFASPLGIPPRNRCCLGLLQVVLPETPPRARRILRVSSGQPGQTRLAPLSRDGLVCAAPQWPRAARCAAPSPPRVFVPRRHSSAIKSPGARHASCNHQPRRDRLLVVIPTEAGVSPTQGVRVLEGVPEGICFSHSRRSPVLPRARPVGTPRPPKIRPTRAA